MSRTAPKLFLHTSLLIATCALVPSGAFAQPITLTGIDEAGSVYNTPQNTTPHYVTALDSATVLYESRLAGGGVIGECLWAPELIPPFPVVGAPTVPLFFAADGINPYPDPSLHHPHLIETGTGIGLYVIDDLPRGTIQFFHSTDGGLTWVHQGALPHGISGGGSGLIGSLTLPPAGGSGNPDLVLYHQSGGGTLRVSIAHPSATGLARYWQQIPSTDPILSGTVGPAGLSPTGGVVPVDAGGYALFFVPQDDSYLGLAVSTDGWNWSVVRGQDDPILSTAANPIAPDPIRPDIREVSIRPSAGGVEGTFTATVPGSPIGTTAIGSFTVDLTSDYLRGDCNIDGLIDLADAICGLDQLFVGASIACPDATDANDDGRLNVADPITIVSFIFAGGSPPPSPWPSCGDDLTPDMLPCPMPTQLCP